MASVSRYDRSPRVDPTTGLRTPPAVPGVVTHTLVDGDRLDGLAVRYYRESRWWWRVCDANPDVLWPFDLVGQGPEGTVRVRLREPRGWRRALPGLLADAGVVSAHLAEPPADGPALEDDTPDVPEPEDTAPEPAVAVVVHRRGLRSAGDVVALLAAAGLAPDRPETDETTGRTVAVPTTVAG